MRRPIIGALLVAVCLAAAPAAADHRWSGWQPYQVTYLNTYEQCWHQFSSQCGRNIVDDGLDSGSPPTRARVESSTATMDRWLHPPAPAAPTTAPASGIAPAVAPAAASTGLTAPVDPNCESGGDPTTNTGNGYYGAYQFDPQTWDAYGDPNYAEASDAPMGVQTAAANSVPYDAWPSC